MTQTLSIHDVNGVHDLALSFGPPGVYRLRGRNGAGKTSTLNAVRAALGDKTATAQPTDGTATGTVEGLGVRLVVGRTKTKTGTPEVALADASPLATLIDPQLKGEAERAKARIQALLRLCPIEVSDDILEQLCGGNAALLDRVGRGGNDLLGYANRARLEAQALARELEAKASEHRGAMQVADAKMGEIGEVPEGTPESSDERDRGAIQHATSRLAVAEQSAKQRAELESRQAEVRANLGERPNLDRFRSAASNTADQVADLKAKLEAARAEHAAAVENLRKAEREAVAYDASARLLEQPLSGATDAEVSDLRTELAQVEAAVELSRKLRARKAAWLAHAAARETALKLEEQSKALRGIADAIPGVLGHALAGAGIPGLTVHDGKLAIRTDAGHLDWDSRLSFGQRVRYSLQLALQAAHADGAKVYALDPEFWLALDPEHKRTVNDIATELGVWLITEEPADGDLRMEPMEAAQ